MGKVCELCGRPLNDEYEGAVCPMCRQEHEALRATSKDSRPDSPSMPPTQASPASPVVRRGVSNRDFTACGMLTLFAIFVNVGLLLLSAVDAGLAYWAFGVAAGCIWGLVCGNIARSKGLDHSTAIVMGLFFGLFALIYYVSAAKSVAVKRAEWLQQKQWDAEFNSQNAEVSDTTKQRS